MSDTALPLAICARDLGRRYPKSNGQGLSFPWSRDAKAKYFWPLKNVSFDVHEGEGLGIVGHNGAGKSTLLKILARIVQPSAGEVTIHGHVNSLLEVGTGFQRELSGRANIYLNASILGMSRAETRELFDEIVAFSGVADFIDMPVKHYSTGMYSRLAFAIAAHVTGDILLVDEVLSVGDAEFRRKSLSRMNQMMQSEHRTVLFVSHSMDAIMRFCDRVMWLDHGQLRAIGPADEVIREYLGSAEGARPTISLPPVRMPESPEPDPQTDDSTIAIAGTRPMQATAAIEVVADHDQQVSAAAVILRASCTDIVGQPQEVFFRDEPIRVMFDFEVREPDWQIAGLVSVRCSPRKGVFDETVVFTDCSATTAFAPGTHTYHALLPKHFFASGEYKLSLGLVSPGKPMTRHFMAKRVLSFRIVDREESGDILGEFLRGVVRPNVLWSTDDV